MPKRSSWARHCLFLHFHHVFVDFHWYLWGQQQNTQKNMKLQCRALIGCRNQVPEDLLSTTGLEINCSNMKRISFNSAFTQTMEVGVGLSWWDAVKKMKRDDVHTVRICPNIYCLASKGLLRLLTHPISICIQRAKVDLLSHKIKWNLVKDNFKTFFFPLNFLSRFYQLPASQLVQVWSNYNS